MGYRLLDHTADVAVAASGPTLGAAIAATADGMAAAHVEEVPPGGERFSFTVEAEDLEALVFDYLDELIYRRDVHGVLAVDNEVEVEETANGFRANASARGVPVASLSAREVKAVTYSDMHVEPTEDGWRTYVVLDV